MLYDQEMLSSHIIQGIHHSELIASLCFSNDKILRIFDLEQPSEPIIKFEGHTSGIKQVRYQHRSPVSITMYFTVLTNSVADPGSGAFLTPGSGMGKNQDPDPG